MTIHAVYENGVFRPTEKWTSLTVVRSKWRFAR